MCAQLILSIVLSNSLLVPSGGLLSPPFRRRRACVLFRAAPQHELARHRSTRRPALRCAWRRADSGWRLIGDLLEYLQIDNLLHESTGQIRVQLLLDTVSWGGGGKEEVGTACWLRTAAAAACWRSQQERPVARRGPRPPRARSSCRSVASRSAPPSRLGSPSAARDGNRAHTLSRVGHQRPEAARA